MSKGALLQTIAIGFSEPIINKALDHMSIPGIPCTHTQTESNGMEFQLMRGGIDYLGPTYLEFELDGDCDNKHDRLWNAINSVTLWLDGNKIESHPGEWLFICSKLNPDKSSFSHGEKFRIPLAFFEDFVCVAKRTSIKIVVNFASAVDVKNARVIQTVLAGNGTPDISPWLKINSIEHANVTTKSTDAIIRVTYDQISDHMVFVVRDKNDSNRYNFLDKVIVTADLKLNNDSRFSMNDVDYFHNIVPSQVFGIVPEIPIYVAAFGMKCNASDDKSGLNFRRIETAVWSFELNNPNENELEVLLFSFKNRGR